MIPGAQKEGIPADWLEEHGVRYLFIGKSAAILLGFPDTDTRRPSVSRAFRQERHPFGFGPATTRFSTDQTHAA
jgi:hypothetical protein